MLPVWPAPCPPGSSWRAWRPWLGGATARTGPSRRSPSSQAMRPRRLTTGAARTAWSVPKQVGDVVRRGDVLALVDAAEVGRAKAEFQQALVQAALKGTTLDSLRESAAVVAGRQLREAEAALREAQIRLLTAE